MDNFQSKGHSNSHSHSHSQIKFISESFVKPKYEVEASKQPYYLGPIDLAFLFLDQMQKGLLFPTKPQHIQSLLDQLTHSLSLSLVHFYPLAGRFVTEKFPDEHSRWIYVDCNKGPGVRLIHASVDFTVSDILSSTDVHPIVSFFFDLGEKAVNHDAHTKPLLAIQVTELLDGVFIGFTMSHSIADGTSMWHFISSLSEIFNDLPISRKPIYEPFWPDGYGPVLKLPYLEPEEFIGRVEPPPFRERIFHFSSESISKLKAVANELCGLQNISSFQSLAAFLWRSITKARNLQPDHESSFTLIANYRPRIDPPFSQGHFGNFLTMAQGTNKVDEILGHDLGWASKLLHQNLKALDDKAIRKFLERYVKAPFLGTPDPDTIFYKPNNVAIGGSARFNTYGPEFGLGKAMAVLSGYSNKADGKVTAYPGREGGGSIDLEVCLKPDIMNALELDDEFMSFVSSV